jgi:hypothetical protein
MKSYWVKITALVCGCILFPTVFTACDDDDIPSGADEDATNKAYRATVEFCVDLGENTLDLFEVVVDYTANDGISHSIYMTENSWHQTYELGAGQLPADFKLRAYMSPKEASFIDMEETYEYGCKTSIPLKVYNKKGRLIASYSGSIISADHQYKQGIEMNGLSVIAWTYNKILNQNWKVHVDDTYFKFNGIKSKYKLQ